MESIPHISDSEWRVMKTLWLKSSMSANEVVLELAKETTWQPKTVKTLINRLLRKGVIAYEKDGREYRYYPVVSQEECVQSHCCRLIKAVYSGSLSPIMQGLLNAGCLSDDDRCTVERIVEVLHDE